MMAVVWCILVLTEIAAFVLETSGHGRLMEPPSRGSMWRQGFDSPVNYGDNQLFCGGFTHQWKDQGGKCGVCGDPYDGPRDHEPGGKYYSGITTRSYQESMVIDVRVELTAFHFGWFEFRLCPLEYRNQTVGQDCFDRYKLKIETESDSGTPSRYKLPPDTSLRFVNVKVKLPQGVTCEQCVLQWKYHAANSWGQDAYGTSCVGCGAQEEFYGCSDISISGNGEGPIYPWVISPAHAGSDLSTQLNKKPSKAEPRLLIDRERLKKAYSWATEKKQNDYYNIGDGKLESGSVKDPWHPISYKPPGAKKAPRTPKAAFEGDNSKAHCRAAGAWKGQQGMTDWCIINCERGFCPETHCNCDKSLSFDVTKLTSDYGVQMKKGSSKDDVYQRGYSPAPLQRQRVNKQQTRPQQSRYRQIQIPSYRPRAFPRSRSAVPFIDAKSLRSFGNRNTFRKNQRWETKGLRRKFGKTYGQTPWDFIAAAKTTTNSGLYKFGNDIGSYATPDKQSDFMQKYEKSFAKLFPNSKKVDLTPPKDWNNEYRYVEKNTKPNGYGLYSKPSFQGSPPRYNQNKRDNEPLGRLRFFNDMPANTQEKSSVNHAAAEVKIEKTEAEYESALELDESEEWLLNSDDDILEMMNADQELVAKARFVDDIHAGKSADFKLPEGKRGGYQNGSPKEQKAKCLATGSWAGQAKMDEWCTANCAISNCPESHCSCE